MDKINYINLYNTGNSPRAKPSFYNCILRCMLPQEAIPPPLPLPSFLSILQGDYTSFLIANIQHETYKIVEDNL